MESETFKTQQNNKKRKKEEGDGKKFLIIPFNNEIILKKNILQLVLHAIKHEGVISPTPPSR